MVRAQRPLKGLRAYRKSLGESQTVFWDRFGVTQAGGSRYERAQAMPAPVALLVLAFAEGPLNDESISLVSARMLNSATAQP